MKYMRAAFFVTTAQHVTDENFREHNNNVWCSLKSFQMAGSSSSSSSTTVTARMEHEDEKEKNETEKTIQLNNTVGTHFIECINSILYRCLYIVRCAPSWQCAMDERINMNRRKMHILCAAAADTQKNRIRQMATRCRRRHESPHRSPFVRSFWAYIYEKKILSCSFYRRPFVVSCLAPFCARIGLHACWVCAELCCCCSW